MKKIKSLVTLIFTLTFLSISQNILSQESQSTRAEKKPSDTSKKRTTDGTSGLRTKSTSSVNPNNTTTGQKQVDTQGKSFQLDENDPYQGRKEEFLSQITLNELPSDFPKYEKWMGIKSYNQIIDEYYRKHLDILKPVVRNKLTQY